MWEELVPALSFLLEKVVPAKCGEHINITELKSWALAEEQQAAAEVPNSWPLIGNDSQAGFAVLVKGRSSSPQLNFQLCSMFATVLGANICPRGF